MDQKTGTDIGSLTYNLSQLSTKGGLEVENQPFGLLRSGPDSKLTMSLKLRVKIINTK